ncbi:predicted protein [Chaetoceros tenuissimus]|uniref:Uncharacterized protein n=1 Tax=Chaetoceros tenuissimus TaxID=426638 RepID=A0AAD3CWE7_9STRA|nr:predicted protein [Chaetoceros tenuissimus]
MKLLIAPSILFLSSKLTFAYEDEGFAGFHDPSSLTFLKQQVELSRKLQSSSSIRKLQAPGECLYDQYTLTASTTAAVTGGELTCPCTFYSCPYECTDKKVCGFSLDNSDEFNEALSNFTALCESLNGRVMFANTYYGEGCETVVRDSHMLPQCASNSCTDAEVVDIYTAALISTYPEGCDATAEISNMKFPKSKKSACKSSKSSKKSNKGTKSGKGSRKK